MYDTITTSTPTSQDGGYSSTRAAVAPPTRRVWLTDYSDDTPSTQFELRDAERLFRPNPDRSNLFLARLTNCYGRVLAQQDVQVWGIAIDIDGSPRPDFGFTPLQTLEDVRAALPYNGLIYTTPKHRQGELHATAVFFFDRSYNLEEVRRVIDSLRRSTARCLGLDFIDPLEPAPTQGIAKAGQWRERLHGPVLDAGLFPSMPDSAK